MSGTLREIWRYPVKSMGGERIDACRLSACGIPGDRAWALRDETAQEIRGAKNLPLLLMCSARYRRAPAEAVHHVDIVLPDGSEIGSDDPDIHARLSRLLGRRVSLCSLPPATDKKHFRRAQKGAFILAWMARRAAFRPYVGAVLRASGLHDAAHQGFGREPGEPLPDLSRFPPALFEYVSPLGTYFDAFPIHLLTTSSLDAMARVHPGADWDVRRFRPNLLVATSQDGLVEAKWEGRRLRLGRAELRCELATVRCAMTMHAQANLPKDASVLRAIVRDADQTLGVYASPIGDADIAVGDIVDLA
jgi:uncharacterized protein YcbX